MRGHDDPLALGMHFLHAGRKRAPLPGTEESMPTPSACITAFFCQVEDQRAGLPKHPEAHLWPRAVVTLGLLHALKGGGDRPCSRWLTRAARALFPPCPRGRGSVGLCRRLTPGRRASGPRRRCSAASPRMASSASSRGAKGAARSRVAAKASRTPAGWAGAPGVCCAISMASGGGPGPQCC
jgi:hypothetical protein